jgi:hypothetical protein
VIDGALAMAESFGANAIDIQTLIDTYNFDSSWRMRYMFSESLDRLVAYMDT